MTKSFENKSEIKQGWQDETAARQESIKQFLKAHFEAPTEERRKYDSIKELHFSGMNWDVQQKVLKGEGQIDKIEVLYKDGKPDSIHIVYNSEEKGHFIDTYLSGKALEDYMSIGAE